MSALGADLTNLSLRDRSQTSTYVVKDAQAMYADGFCALDADGVLVPWSDTAGLKFLGLFRGWTPALTAGVPTTIGETDAPAVRGIVREDGPTLYGVDVTGVSDRTTIGDPVYCTTDNHADLTLTPTAFVGPIGWLKDFRSTSSMDVRLKTPGEYAASLGAGVGHWVRHIDLALITGAGDVVTAFTPGFRGRIIKWWAEVVTPVTTGSKAATLNIEVGTTNATGGTIALTSAAATPLGAVIAQGSVFTAGTAFSATDTVSIEAASVTAFAEGSINLVIQYRSDE